ncbi:DNA methyltransferase [Methylobacterium sp. NEAU 140]|uniref:site-specific DNA-methyltransferase n=1 Tax=Methylobacterium sp. NEAU 140 TaxID=3064945 RepID=UPI00273321A7|nr:DNA methyltransferase [Methylobacterium sp. NEAU 140]MDP4026662.1 DNA methyltransferase [Methylobacterium sp. NEAU 140]
MRITTAKFDPAANDTAAAPPHLSERIALRPLTSLRCDPGNARTHSTKQLRLIAGSIEQFGFINPVVIDADGLILAGHGRYAAARQLGLPAVPTIQVDHLSPAQRRAYALADNKLSELSGWDRDLLRIQIEELDGLDFDLGLTGFSVPEIEAILDPGQPLDSEDTAVAPAPGPAVSRPGDLWLLGPHRLLCGSALEAAAYADLMDGERAEAVFTDPPFNVPIHGHVSGGGKVRHREFAMAAGEMTAEAFTTFLRTAFTHLVAHSADGSIHFVCMDWRHMRELLAASEGIYALKNLCIWNKDNGGMGSLYRSKHELVFVLKAGTAPHTNNVELGRHGRNRTNVWDYSGQNTFHRDRAADLAAHPTVKPVALVADALRDVSVRGDVVLDPFCGSGTTILAAERTRRQARGIEYDPAYVDVALRRYADATGGVARLASTGQTFAEVAAARAAEASADDASGEVGHAA